MSYFKDVVEWHKAFGVSCPDKPIEPDWSLRHRLISEEDKETRDAIVDRDKVKTLDGLVDIVWVCIGMAAASGWDFDEAWERVKESNWSKLGEDGKPARNEWGKITKGPNFKPPKLDDLV